MKSLLIVDDEVDLAESLASFLELKGFKTIHCDSVEKALAIFSSTPIDLVISDVRMPHKDGVFFYETIKNELKTKDIPFIFMTGYSEKVDLQKAYEMGVDEFINKPFEYDDLVSVLKILLKGESEDIHKGEKFYKVELKEFLLGSISDYDIFLNVNGQYLCLAKRRQELLPERLINYSRKGMQHIYLTSGDFSSYIGMQVNIAPSIMASKPLAKVKKIRLFNHFCKTVSESTFSDCMNEDLYHKVYGSFESYTQLALDHQDLSELIVSLNDYNKQASSRSILVSFLALAIFHEWGWTSPRHLSRISLSALLCDIGLREMPELTQKDPADMSGAELKEYEKHPLLSYLILSKIKGMPSEILYVASQHHENESGLGFPHKMSKMKIHPYARVIHALIEFVDKVDSLTSKASIKECLDTLLGFEQRLISTQILKTLYMIFEIPIPQEMQKILLPTETSRLT